MGPVLNAQGSTTGRKGLPENEVLFHAATVHASGGMLLSGDNLPNLSQEGVAVLRKMLPPTGRAARFTDEQLTVGRTSLGRREWIYLFNWGEVPVERSVTLAKPVRLLDYWTGRDLGLYTNEFHVPALPPHTARVIEAQPPAF
jgi:alpha-galactosidase